MYTIRQSFSVDYSFPVIFTRNAFDSENGALRQVLERGGEQGNRILPVIDSGVFQAMPQLPQQLEDYAAAHPGLLEFVTPPVIYEGGEACKNDRHSAERLHQLVEKHNLCRHSFILAIGGGAVLDAAGFAAATAHRGIRLIRMPTTTLAQNDAGVGVKNAVNLFGRKNFIGTFAPPFAVINDFVFLETLSPADRRAGLAEAVKVALIRDRGFFDYLYRNRLKLATFAPEETERMIIRCAELHLEHIASGDPFEAGSSRPLDFGHWSAHKLEEMTKGEIRHGEAVAIGIALDTLYSFQSGLISEIELKRVIRLLEDLGFSLYHGALGWMDIDRALSDFREHLGGTLAVTLLEGIGHKRDCHEINRDVMRGCIRTLAERGKKENDDDQQNVGRRNPRRDLP